MVTSVVAVGLLGVTERGVPIVCDGGLRLVGNNCKTRNDEKSVERGMEIRMFRLPTGLWSFEA